MRLFLVRHGETAWNLERRYQGRTDVDLCAAGLATARGIASALETAHVALLLASPLRRARVTAGVVGEALGGLPTVVDERLTEIDFGEWQGLTQQEVKAHWPRALRLWKQAPQTMCFPGGESLGEALERLRDFLRHPPWEGRTVSGDVLAVSHAGPIRLAGLVAERRPLAQFRQIAVDPGAVHAFEWSAGGALRRASCQ